MPTNTNRQRICLDCYALIPEATAKWGRCQPCAILYAKRTVPPETPRRQTPQRKARAAVYQTPAWKRLRRHIITRDQNSCTNCGNQTALSVHHIRPIVEAPDLALDPDNCITLCQRCHATLENKKRARRTRSLGGEGS